MKITRAVAVLVLALASTSLFAATRNITDDVLKMYKAGVAEEAIIDFVHKTDGRLEVTADDIIAMSDAHVPRTIIKAVLDEADVRNGRNSRDVRGTRETVVVSPGYISPWVYDPYYYDPFWYPRFSVGFGFGRGYYGGGRGWGGGHGGHGGHGRH